MSKLIIVNDNLLYTSLYINMMWVHWLDFVSSLTDVYCPRVTCADIFLGCLCKIEFRTIREALIQSGLPLE